MIQFIKNLFFKEKKNKAQQIEKQTIKKTHNLFQENDAKYEFKLKTKWFDIYTKKLTSANNSWVLDMLNDLSNNIVVYWYSKQPPSKEVMDFSVYIAEQIQGKLEDVKNWETEIEETVI